MKVRLTALLVLISLNFFAEGKSEVAYVTLLYGEAFLLGVRVLGQSLREAQTEADMVVLSTGEMTKSGRETLEGDGWIVRRVETIANPGKGPQRGKGFPKRFSAVYTKLTIFNLTEYKKVVYLDADTLVVQNVDALFSCGGFCAAVRHSERMNSGVMVVTPSTETFEKMVSKIASIPSYTGGDQGFLNVYFDGFVESPMFDQNKNTVKASMMRLETAYNADIGLYILNSDRWMIDENAIKIIHFTLGPFKPWYWWTSWVISNLDDWQGCRSRLPKDARGNGQGTTARQLFSIRVLSWVPLAGIVFTIYKFRIRNVPSTDLKSEISTGIAPTVSSHSLMSKTGLPKRFVGTSICIGYSTLLLSLWSVLTMIPNEIVPFWGWLLTYEWVMSMHALIFGFYLNYCYETGKRAGAAKLPTFKHATWSNPWKVTTKAVVASSLLAFVAPWMGSLLGIASVFARLGITIACTGALCIMLTHVYSTLPVRWFAYGRNEGGNKSGSC